MVYKSHLNKAPQRKPVSEKSKTDQPNSTAEINPFQPGADMDVGQILALQSTIGNQAVQRLIAQQTPAITPHQERTIQRDTEGLAGPGSLMAFTQTAMAQGLPTSADEARGVAQNILAKANENLAKAGVPPVLMSWVNLGATQGGELRPPSWTIEINKQRPYNDQQAITTLANTIYHECRHAEQFFKIAQLLAHNGLNAQQIAQATQAGIGSIQAGAINQAITQANQAASWDQALVTKVTNWYNAVFDSPLNTVVNTLTTGGNLLGNQTTRLEQNTQNRNNFSAQLPQDRQRVNILMQSINNLMNDPGSNADQDTANQTAAVLGGNVPQLVTNFIQAVNQPDDNLTSTLGRTIHQTLVDHLQNIQNQIVQADQQYRNAAHEVDAYATGDAVDLAVAAINKQITPLIQLPNLPNEINSGNWKTAVTIPKKVMGMTVQHSGGSKIKKITAKITEVEKAHTKAHSTSAFVHLYGPLIDVRKQAMEWMAEKAAVNKGGANFQHRLTAVQNLKTATDAYLRNINWPLV